MKSTSRATILFVDDEPCMRELMAMILSEEGYEVLTATDGLDALAQLRNSTPDLIISDLQMPGMSGIEFLSVVRHRFPAIPVLAISGAFDQNESCSAGVMADAFYPKARCHPDELMRTVSDLMHLPLNRPTNYHPCQPPRVQTARSAREGDGIPQLLLTCTDCLRAFAVALGADAGQGIQQANCQFCRTPVHFVTESQREASQRTMGSGCEPASVPAG